MKIEPVSLQADVVALLQECGFPAEESVADSSAEFFGIRCDGRLSGVVGLELHDGFGFLLVLAVGGEWRGRDLGNVLLAFAETHALAHSVDSLYLFASSSVSYFQGQGYGIVARNAVPSAVGNTRHFAGLGLSQACLAKKLGLMA